MLRIVEIIRLRKQAPAINKDAPRASLAERFLIPPFSVLDARQGYWQNRKRAWIDLGIKSELGRGEDLQDRDLATVEEAGQLGLSARLKARINGRKNGLLGFSEQARGHYRTNATPGGSPLPSASLKDGRTQRGDGRGRPLAKTFGSGNPGDLAAGFAGKTDEAQQSAQSGTSIFDPVLCELAYRWFTPTNGSVLDPFAGGSVRGIVASYLGRSYCGIDLRPEQVEANIEQQKSICPDSDIQWIAGDSLNIRDLVTREYDFLFSCPPYADLERYSDNPLDLSTMEYDTFLRKYRAIIAESCLLLRQDRFACFVVGDIRDRKSGNYRNFVSDTIQAFKDAGLELYNESILVTSVGSLPIRVGKQFAKYRKLGKTHQNVLVFLKGCAAQAAMACGEVDIDDLEMPEVAQDKVAICVQDMTGLDTARYMGVSDKDVMVIDRPLMESCLLIDVIRGEARSKGKPSPRIWIASANGWQRVPEDVELTYLIGDTPYLNKSLYPSAKTPSGSPLPIKKFGA